MTAIATKPTHDLIEVASDGGLDLNFHEGQWKAWESERRFIAVIAGTQSGKTSFGPLWLYREIQLRGPGHYLVVTPTFAILEKKALPEFLVHFKRRLDLGVYVGSPVRKFTFSEQGSIRTFGEYDPNKPTVIFFGYAEDPDSLESATAKAAWLDEAGQKKFKLGSWEAIQRRLSIAEGRALITTTPYDLGWLKQQIHDKWKAGDEDFEVVRFDSTENPMFPQAEFDRAKRTLPKWKFDLFYRGIFTRPAGQIYDNFLDELDDPLGLTGHRIKRFNVPEAWDRYLGLDFGGVNTAGMFYAAERNADNNATGRYIAYREYLEGGRTAKVHAEYLLKGEPRIPVCVGGSWSEGQWRDEFRAGGLTVKEPPIKEVEVGINRVYGAHAENKILVFDDLKGYLAQKTSYSRELNDKGEVLEKIEDKATFHYLDAERYIMSHLFGKKKVMTWS